VFLVALQSLLRADARFVFLLAGLVTMEILYSAFLIARLNYGPRPRALSVNAAPRPRSGDGLASPYA
jgi:hypothetical protein